MDYKIHVLGTGNLFTSHLTNTSFLVEQIPKVIGTTPVTHTLIDCGYNVFDKLLNGFCSHYYLSDLDVYITHNHPDHIGGLGALIYYRYFFYNKLTRIYTGERNKQHLSKFLKSSISLVGRQGYPITVFEERPYLVLDAEDVFSDNINRDFEMFQVNHGPWNFPCYGVYHRKTKTLFTGDTGMLSPQNRYFQIANRIFHDVIFEVYAPEMHAHYKDIQNHYSKEVTQKLLGVHHGFNKSKVDDYNSHSTYFKLAYEGQVFECPET